MQLVPNTWEVADVTTAERRLRLSMVGGGRGAFIGAVHCIALQIDDPWELVPLSRRITRRPTGRTSARRPVRPDHNAAGGRRRSGLQCLEVPREGLEAACKRSRCGDSYQRASLATEPRRGACGTRRSVP